MSLSEYVRYENVFKCGFIRCKQKTTKEEWTERFELVFKCSKNYMALNKQVSDAYINYLIYKNKYLYTDDKETTLSIKTDLYHKYYSEYKKQFDLKIPIIKAFKEKFPNIYNPDQEVGHYLFCCELYESHRLKGIEYNLPFPVETDSPPALLNDFPLGVEESKSSDNTEPPPENKPPSKPEGKWEDLKVVRIKSKPIVIREVKKPGPKKHTLSILLTQEKEKTRKLQEVLKQYICSNNNDT